MKKFHIHWQVPQEDNGISLKDFLKKQRISKAALADIKFKGGLLLVNGGEVTVRHILQESDAVTVFFPPEIQSEGLKAENIPLEIMYEDDYVLVINKPPYMNTIPSREHPSGSIANAVAGYYMQNDIASTVHVVTRLDRDTSGLLLIAKHRHVHHLLCEQQKQGGISRIYEAFVHGSLEGEGRIEKPIGRKHSSIIEREVREDGQYACTLYAALAQKEAFTHVQLKLLTGRTHQIRVHMAYMGHPLLGDTLYGGSPNILDRQGLHCKKLTFQHPFREQTFTFEAPLKADMMDLLAETGR